MVQSIFEFIGDNPPTALIVGGILMLLLSAILNNIDISTAEFLRNTGWALIVLGIALHLLWLLPRLAKSFS